MSFKKAIVFAGCVGLSACLVGCSPKKVQTTAPQIELEQKVRHEKMQKEADGMRALFDEATSVFTGRYYGKKGSTYFFAGNWYHKQDGIVLPFSTMYLASSSGKAGDKATSIIIPSPPQDVKFKNISDYIIFTYQTDKGETLLKAYPVESEYTAKLRELLNEYRKR